MKLPSLTTLAREAAGTFRRFPLVLLDALAGTIAAIILIERSYDNRNGPEERIFLCALLGIAFLFGVTMFAERKGWSRSRVIVAQLSGVVLLTLYGLTLPAQIFIPPFMPLIRFWVIVIAAHLFVAFAAFTRRGETNGFWQFNRILFLRSLTSILYAGVLYAGLAIAIAAVDHLFNANVKGERYLELYAVITGLFMTWFFLSGVPEQVGSLEGETHYPRALKIFTQYVLLPLVVVYLAILYAYTIKILVTWNWPQGWVGNLVLGFSITGIFSLLLVYPIQNLTENVWMRTFARWFHVALIPLVGLLLLAIWRRLGEYGMTENRYFVFILGLWLAAMVVLSFVMRGKQIKAIPITLCLVAILACWGPWSAFAVSSRSQLARLTEILERNGMISNGKARPPTVELQFADIKELSSIIRYMLHTHDVSELQPFFEPDLRKVLADSGVGSSGDWAIAATPHIVHLLGVEYIDEWRTADRNAYSFGAVRRQSVDVRGYDFYLPSFTLAGLDRRKFTSPESLEVHIALADSGSTLLIDGGDLQALRLPFRPMLDSVMNRYARTNKIFQVDPDVMSLHGESEGLKASLFLHTLQVERRGETLRVQSLEAEALISHTIHSGRKR